MTTKNRQFARFKINIDGYTISIYISRFNYVAKAEQHGCKHVTTGKTREEAIANMREAIAKFKSGI